MKNILLFLTFLAVANPDGGWAQQHTSTQQASGAQQAPRAQQASRPVHGSGLVWNESTRIAIKTRVPQVRSAYALPARYSLRNFSPIPGDQQATATGAAWACAYTAMTLQLAKTSGWQGKELITQQAYSPGFTYKLTNPDDKNCSQGTSIEAVLQCLKYQGALTPQARQDRIKDYSRLFDPAEDDASKIMDVQKSISEGRAVIVGLLCPPSFLTARQVWTPTEQPTQTHDGQAVCVVGYDNSSYGGAFDIQNSWGTSWGQDGCTWIRYKDFVRFAQTAYTIIDIPPMPTGPTAFNIDLSGSFQLQQTNGDPISLTISAREGGLIAYRPTAPLSKDTKFRIYTHTTTPEYIYILESDSNLNVDILFPYNDAVSAALDYADNNLVYPDETNLFTLGSRPGPQYLCLICSKDELDIDAMVHTLGSSGPPSVRERLKTVFKEQLLEGRNIRVEKNGISFQASSTIQHNAVIAIVEFPSTQ